MQASKQVPDEGASGSVYPMLTWVPGSAGQSLTAMQVGKYRPEREWWYNSRSEPDHQIGGEVPPWGRMMVQQQDHK